MESIALQQCDGPLEEVDTTYTEAIRIGPRYADAFVEFAWYQLNVRDNPKEADRSFQQALEMQRDANTEIAIGLLKCAMELNSWNVTEPDEFRDKLIEKMVDKQKIKDALDD